MNTATLTETPNPTRHARRLDDGALIFPLEAHGYRVGDVVLFRTPSGGAWDPDPEGTITLIENDDDACAPWQGTHYARFYIDPTPVRGQTTGGVVVGIDRILKLVRRPEMAA